MLLAYGLNFHRSGTSAAQFGAVGVTISKSFLRAAIVPRLRYVSIRGREDKFTKIAQCFSDYLNGDVLDVGCDARHLSSLVQGRYVGVDIAGFPDIQLNVEEGLPFCNRCFDTVVAFDVLEHCDRIHFVFDELCRVARSYVVIGLPNMYEWSFRVMFLLGKKLSGKYGLDAQGITDRHRWLFGLSEARSFVRTRGEKNGFNLVEEALAFFAYRRVLARMINTLGRILTPRGASLFAYSYWAVLKRDE